MKNFTAGVAISLIVTLGLAPLTGSANSDEECGSTAKSIFSNAGTLMSDGGRRSPPVQVAADKVKPKDKPVPVSCRHRPTASASKVTVATSTSISIVPHSGLAFWIEKLRCGAATSQRTTEYRFVTGDCAKLFFMPNIEGFLYVANVDSNNKVDYLFPQRGENNFLRAGEDAKFGVEFVGSPGIEQVFVMFSKTKIANIPDLALSLAGRRAVLQSQPEHTYSVLLADANGQTNTSKSLRRTDEVVSTSTPDAARYLVIADSELINRPVIAISLNLIHTPR